jgi:hypothetical protein
MPHYEYKVIPAPLRGEKSRTAKTTGDRFGLALSNVMNAMAQDNWEYLRAETLPCEERVGFTGRATTFQNMLVFRRLLANAAGFRDDGRMPAVATPVAPVMTAPQAGPSDAGIPRLGTAEVRAGPAPAVGPVRPELAAE